jgi:hypothetical protein
MPVKGTKLSLMARIQGKYTVNTTTGCWIWARSLSTQGKYPTVAGEVNGKRPVYAYRATYEDKFGPIPTTPCPDGSHRWELHHKCAGVGSTQGGTNRCVNPDHIMLVTSKEHRAIHKAMRAELKAAKATKKTPKKSKAPKKSDVVTFPEQQIPTTLPIAA